MLYVCLFLYDMSTSVYSNLLILALHILHIFCKDNQNVYDIKSELEVFRYINDYLLFPNKSIS